MAARFCDSFDHYATADIASKWTNLINTPTISTGRETNGLNASGNTRAVAKTLDSQATWICGFAFKMTNVPTGNGAAIIAFYDGATLHVDLRPTTSSTLQATRNGSLLGTGTAVLSTGVFYFIEVKVTISDTVGVFQTKVNGVSDINLTGQDTRNGGNSTADTIRIGVCNTAQGWDPAVWDDFYALDGTGGSNNDFLANGDVRVEYLIPNGSGNYSQWTGSDGNQVNNYQQVDDSTPNGDTDYNEDSTVNDIDTYTLTDATPTSGSVYFTQPVLYARKTDAGTRSIRSLLRLSGTDAAAAADDALGTNYLYYTDIRETKPGGGSWTITDVNNVEAGQKVTA